MLLLIFICLGATQHPPRGLWLAAIRTCRWRASQLHHAIIPQLGASYQSDLYPLPMRWSPALTFPALCHLGATVIEDSCQLKIYLGVCVLVIIIMLGKVIFLWYNANVMLAMLKLLTVCFWYDWRFCICFPFWCCYKNSFQISSYKDTCVCISLNIYLIFRERENNMPDDHIHSQPLTHTSSVS